MLGKMVKAAPVYSKRLAKLAATVTNADLDDMSGERAIRFDSQKPLWR